MLQGLTNAHECPNNNDACCSTDQELTSDPHAVRCNHPRPRYYPTIHRAIQKVGEVEVGVSWATGRTPALTRKGKSSLSTQVGPVSCTGLETPGNR
ncbi:hypothetical protein P7K49_028507 [Saguinus oedipus]|uniref:Uncharacterized protein n=1 Tax=Saguinus oedipus TaxID=9490 RepID=A0ABQ9U4J2_SAGOE|nr:hypothetical protein P7K49_028507 [Saguinus oedipus]